MNALTPIAPVLQPQSFAELVQFAKLAADSDLMPRDYKGKPANVMLAVQMGSEVGLSPMQAIQNIAVINGRPALWGDAMLGLCRASPACDDIVETLTGEGDNLTATCVAKRRGSSAVKATFSASDAKRAGLWGKQGPWQQYPQRMLQMRARGFALRDAFPDVLRGLLAAEEAGDMPPREPFKGTTIDAQAKPEPVPTPAPAEAAPADEYEAPRYPFATKTGGRMYSTGSEWLEAWKRLIQACQTTDALDKVRVAADMNEGPIETVSEFDPAAAAEVKEMIAAAARLEAEVTKPKAEMELPQ